MNYQPFSALAQGAIFKALDKGVIPMMKISKEEAVFLEGAWISGILFPRGHVTQFSPTTCVNLRENGEVVLPALRLDPVDPSRRFWKDGDTRSVGERTVCHINIFAGLFLYSGLGQGTYYSAIDKEVFAMNTTEARNKAEAEGIPFVYFDSFGWTNDPTLARERKNAQETFDRVAKEKAENSTDQTSVAT